MPLQAIAESAQRARRPLFSPLSVQVEIIDSCMQNCIFCLQASREGDGPVPIGRLRLLAKELADLRVAEVVISGGEPGCHPEFPEVIGAFKERGMRVVIETSGADLPLSFLPALDGHLDPDQDLLRVSVDAASAETYRILRGVDAFDQLQEFLDSVQQRKIRFATSTVMMRQNRDELSEIVTLAWETGAVACEFGPPFVDGPSPLPGEMQPEEVLDCFEALLALPVNIPVHVHASHVEFTATCPGNYDICCPAGFVGCAVDVKGRVAFCHYMNDVDSALGTWEPGLFGVLWKSVADARAWVEEKAAEGGVSVPDTSCPAKLWLRLKEITT